MIAATMPVPGCFIIASPLRRDREVGNFPGAVMRHQGLSFFLLVVTVCLMEAWQGRSWPVIALWLCLGTFVLLMDSEPSAAINRLRHRITH